MQSRLRIATFLCRAIPIRFVLFVWALVLGIVPGACVRVPGGSGSPYTSRGGIVGFALLLQIKAWRTLKAPRHVFLFRLLFWCMHVHVWVSVICDLLAFAKCEFTSLLTLMLTFVSRAALLDKCWGLLNSLRRSKFGGRLLKAQRILELFRFVFKCKIPY